MKIVPFLCKQQNVKILFRLKRGRDIIPTYTSTVNNVYLKIVVNYHWRLGYAYHLTYSNTTEMQVLSAMTPLAPNPAYWPEWDLTESSLVLKDDFYSKGVLRVKDDDIVCFEHFVHEEMEYFGKVSALSMWHPGNASCLNCLGPGGEDGCPIVYQDTEQLVLIAGITLMITILVIIIAYFLFC